MTIPSHVSVSTGSVYVPLQDMHIARVQPDVNARYNAAEMSITTRNPDIEVDWQPVWDSIGLENLMSYMRNTWAREVGQSFETIAQIARDGDQVARSVTSGEDNVFGRLGVDKFHRNREVETRLVLMPDTMPKFSVTIYKPDIRIEPQKPNVDPIESRPSVSLKPLQNTPSVFIDQRI
ncbi:hypothetical protein K0T92_09570 [Paenibacillus oenotherae]|uniref:Bacterial CdiA-CT RNAse A domain-containing protein n=1 Tax=Paenibacillus oenotherae TaxID=1435645 RepID=A0ABS7D503_9BACL|nr:DUF6470 family protein [Paenibacillus oenotherae]MBW7474993.1 hypothetical protein [Paenibacillus oenotherae]